MSPNRIYYRMFGYVVTLVMHTVNIATILSAFYGQHIKDPEINHFREMKLFFFTSWNFSFQILYAAFSLYCDIRILRHEKSGYKLPKLYENIRKEFFNVIIWPATFLVFTVFWSFWFYDRDLLYPTAIDKAISKLSNQIMHGYILPVVLWEMMFSYRSKPKRNTLRITCSLVIEVLYIIILFCVKKYYGVWVYPIFAKLDGTIFMPSFFIVIAVILTAIYHLQWPVYNIMWGRQRKLSSKSS